MSATASSRALRVKLVATPATPVPPAKAVATPITDHAGRPLARDVDLFAPAPPEIGQIQTAASTLRRGMQPPSDLMRVLTTLACAFAGLLVGAFLLVGALIGKDVTSVAGMAAIVGVPTLLGALVGFGRSAFVHSVTYVGSEGVAKITCAWRRDDVKSEVFLFKNAWDLDASITNVYRKLVIYVRTDYVFAWRDAGKNRVHTISGSYRTLGDTAPADSEFWFASSARRAFERFKLARAA